MRSVRGSASAAAAGLAAALVLALTAAGCEREGPSPGGAAGSGDGAGGTATAKRKVVVYVSLDKDYAEPILKRFEDRTGITVEPLYDTEKDKSVGLAQRLVSEKADPQADVFWNNEPVNTVWAARKGVFTAFRPRSAEDIPGKWRDPAGMWTGFAGRARVVIYNRTKIKPNAPPKTLRDLIPFGQDANVRALIARPVAGTTATHVAALFAAMGPGAAKSLLLRLKESGVSFAAAANSTVARNVAEGEAAVGLTDTDDVLELIRQGKDVGMSVMTGGEGSEKPLVLPNTVSVVRNGPHPVEARLLAEYLASREVEQLLSWGPSRQIPLRPDLPLPDELKELSDRDWMPLDLSALADHREEAAAFVREKLLAE
jgi:iron(III) transport system substrate-binding protein